MGARACSGQVFPPKFVEHAFERFSRADGSLGGAGLGLAIVAAIAHAHGGTTDASNMPGGGADVALAVPLTGQAGPTATSSKALSESPVDAR